MENFLITCLSFYNFV